MPYRKSGFLVGRRKDLQEKKILTYGNAFYWFTQGIKLILNGSKGIIIILKTRDATNLRLWLRCKNNFPLMHIMKPSVQKVIKNKVSRAKFLILYLSS